MFHRPPSFLPVLHYLLDFFIQFNQKCSLFQNQDLYHVSAQLVTNMSSLFNYIRPRVCCTNPMCPQFWLCAHTVHNDPFYIFLGQSSPQWCLDVDERKTITWAHTGLIGSRSFQNYAFKGWLSLETMKLWLLVLKKTLF